MTQRAHFWTYRAGTRVLATDGSEVGHVAAVRRSEVLVTDHDGESRWIAGGSVLNYDGTTLTVTGRPMQSRNRQGVQSVQSDRLIAEATFWTTGRSGFDA